MAITPILSKFLPNRPSEEYLRKEAKRLARGDSMQLAAAQRRLAREYGYPNWAGLIDAVQEMASPSGDGSGADTSRMSGSPPARDSATPLFPLLPLRGLVAFPHVSYPIFLGRPKSINAVLHAKEHNIPILLAAQKDSRVEDVTGPEMYKVGTLATVVETVQLPDGTVKSIIEGNKRASLGHISFDEDFAKAEAVEAEEPPISDPRLVSLVSSVLSAFVREHIRAVSAWEKAPESAGLTTAAIILQEEQSSIESILKELLRQRPNLARNDRFSEIIANSPAMLEMLKLMKAAAASSVSVLIEGETGSGKELVARAIHRTSDRAGGPFMALNCAAIPEGLMESELFGHRRGAFTSPFEDKPGLFRAASGGVLFLDEIDRMPLAMQAKLLRAIEEREVTAVGDTHPHKVDVRLLSATSDLQAAIADRSFRQDLYYRLAALIIRVPSLRQRREDIPSLAALFVERGAERHRKRIQGIEPEALELLTEAGWPGNVRQLQNEMERAVALARDGDTISVRHLSPAPTAIDFRLRQQLVMTPLLQQAIKILQLSLPELEAVVKNELGGALVELGSPASAKSAPLAEAVPAFEQKLIAEQPGFAKLLHRYLKPNEASALADRIASSLRMELASKQALLETLNPAERLETLLAYMNALS